MTSRRLVGDVEGEILDKHGLGEQHDSHHITYDKFQKDMQKYTEIEKDIISELTNSVRNNLARETFDQLVLNFRGKDSLIRKSIAEVNKQIKKLGGEIAATQSPAKSYATELNKLEVSKLKTFKWLLLEELKNENLRKQEALKLGMRWLKAFAPMGDKGQKKKKAPTPFEGKLYGDVNSQQPQKFMAECGTNGLVVESPDT